MSLLNTLATDANIEDEKDTLGGGGVLESGIYNCLVTMAYLDKSAGGALSLRLHFKTQEGREFRQCLWIASGDAKGNKNYYETKNGEKKYLPGYIHANALSLLTVGKELPNMDTEQKVVNVYNAEAQAEVPTKVEVLMDLLNQPIKVGLLKQTVDKRSKADDGSYQPTGETREENEIDKLFRASDSMTTAEIRAQAEEAMFIHTWEQKWAGKTKDKTSKDSGTVRPMAGSNGATGRPVANNPRPTASLFG